jgi:hypothetical protein
VAAALGQSRAEQLEVDDEDPVAIVQNFRGLTVKLE